MVLPTVLSLKDFAAFIYLPAQPEAASKIFKQLKRKSNFKKGIDESLVVCV